MHAHTCMVMTSSYFHMHACMVMTSSYFRYQLNTNDYTNIYPVCPIWLCSECIVWPCDNNMQLMITIITQVYTAWLHYSLCLSGAACMVALINCYCLYAFELVFIYTHACSHASIIIATSSGHEAPCNHHWGITMFSAFHSSSSIKNMKAMYIINK